MIETIRVRNPMAFEIPEIQELMTDAFANVTNKAVKSYAPESIEDPNVGLFLAKDTDTAEWKGMAWVRNSDRDDDRSALVIHFFSRRAGRGVREALVREVVNFAKAGDMETLMAWDINRKARAFQKIFKSAGPSKEVIRAYEFDLSQAEV